MSTKIGILVAVCANLIVGVGNASAIPPDQRIELQFRSVPSDPASPVEVQAVLTLSAESADGNAIGWRIKDVTFSRPNQSRTGQWSARGISTHNESDGLWWVNHADAENPATNEFTEFLPSISGIAESESVDQSRLSFDISGSDFGGSQGPFPNTAFAQYSIGLTDADEPVVDGDDEPVEANGSDPH